MTATQLFSCECCEVFKSSFFINTSSGYFWRSSLNLLVDIHDKTNSGFASKMAVVWFVLRGSFPKTNIAATTELVFSRKSQSRFLKVLRRMLLPVVNVGSERKLNFNKFEIITHLLERMVENCKLYLTVYAVET